ncbi:MAG: HAD family hydrolase [Chloroflexi bacterium]|nr:HAD family hydrolase [Chloroflexota bacterium]
MVKAVFLDFYGTLVRFDPPAEGIQANACANHGLQLDAQAILRAYPVADEYLAQENARSLVWRRPEADRDTFFAEYERRLLAAAGHEVSLATAASIWKQVNETPKGLWLYEDALPAIHALRDAGLTTGIITNMDTDIGDTLYSLGIRELIDLWVTSGDVGSGKPHRPIFDAALAKAEVSATEAMHVGDHYEGDVLGARGAGLRALFLSRNAVDTTNDNATISTLLEIIPYIQRNGLLPGY